MKDDLRLAEYAALRATIRERGSVRMCAILVGLVAWAALALGLALSELSRASTLVPLLVLATTFEISFFLHTGVERVGRYIQVFYEEISGDGWEHIIMLYGKHNPGAPDPLFTRLFGMAAVVNFATSFGAAARHPGWIPISLVAHLVLGWRFTQARRLAASQRALDLERFRDLKGPSSPTNWVEETKNC